MEQKAPKEELNLWDCYPLDYADTIEVHSVRLFYNLLTSSSTRYVILSGLSVPYGYADCDIYGPITDDVNSHQSERQGCLSAHFKLRKVDIHDDILGLTKEERRILTEKLRKLRKGGSSMQLLCDALKLERVK
jgi:hypothetical protein